MRTIMSLPPLKMGLSSRILSSCNTKRVVASEMIVLQSQTIHIDPVLYSVSLHLDAYSVASSPSFSYLATSSNFPYFMNTIRIFFILCF